MFYNLEAWTLCPGQAKREILRGMCVPIYWEELEISGVFFNHIKWNLKATIYNLHPHTTNQCVNQYKSSVLIWDMGKYKNVVKNQIRRRKCDVWSGYTLFAYKMCF